MTTITDEQLYAHATRAKDRVVIITGGSNGFGRETALLYGKHGAKVVIGDLDVKGAEQVIAQIVQAGGQGAYQRCDVLNWDDQVALFELAISRYGSVDIVIPNAGISEAGVGLGKLMIVDGKPKKPVFKTLEINLIAVMYTVHLGLHYVKQNRSEGDLKALIFVGSMASWEGIVGAPLYTASKHSILGVMRSIHTLCLQDGIRVGVIHPFFANTAILPTAVKVFLAGIPLTPVERVAGALFYAATDPDMETSGSVWLLPDDGFVFQLEKERLTEGVYKMLNDRTQFALGGAQKIRRTVATIRDLTRLLGKQVLVLGVAVAGAKYLYANEGAWGFVQHHATVCADHVNATLHQVLY